MRFRRRKSTVVLSTVALLIMFNNCDLFICTVHFCSFQGISYYDSEITADLFDMNEFGRCSADPPLVYKDLIEFGIIEHSPFLSTNR